jgi:hypothetical protein
MEYRHFFTKNCLAWQNIPTKQHPGELLWQVAW